MTTYTLHRAKLAYSLLPMEQKDIGLRLGVTQQRVSQLLYRYKVWERRASSRQVQRSFESIKQRREHSA